MQQIITAKLKLLATPEQFHELRQTQLAYRDALNYISQYAFEQGKTSNEKRLREGTYYEIRSQFKLPSEMTNNAIRQVAGTYRGLWTKAKKNAEHRKNKITRKRFKGLDTPSKYVSPTITYNFGYDYGFKSEQQVSIRTLERRVVIAYQGYEKHIACGYRDEKNRPGKGLLFICQNKDCIYRLCTGQAYILHADLVGARNIAMRTLCVWQDWRQTGQLSVAPGSECGPHASDSELKAAKRSRLERYADLRWES